MEKLLDLEIVAEMLKAFGATGVQLVGDLTNDMITNGTI